MLSLLDKKHSMMKNYTPISEELPDNGHIVFEPKKEFEKNGKLADCMKSIVLAFNDINYLPSEEREKIKRKIAMRERALKYGK